MTTVMYLRNFWLEAIASSTCLSCFCFKNRVLMRSSSYQEQRASLLGARALLGAPGLTTSNKDATRSKCIASSNKCLTTSNKDATSNKGHRY